MEKLQNTVFFAICLWLPSIFFGQPLAPSISKHSDWSAAEKLEFIYENVNEATDTQTLSMVFQFPDARGFFWECDQSDFVPFDNFYHYMDASGNITSHLGYHLHHVLQNGPLCRKFSGARLRGSWYSVEVTDIQCEEGKCIVTHTYILQDTIFLIDYVPLIGVIGFTKNGVRYRLKSINDVPFVLSMATSVFELRRKPFK